MSSTTFETVFPIQEFFQQTNWFRIRIQSVPRSLPEILNHCLAFSCSSKYGPFCICSFNTIRKHSQRSSQLCFLTLASKFRQKILSQTERKFCESVLAQKLVSLPTKWQQDVFIACSSNWGSVGAMWVPASVEHKGMLGWQTGRHDQHRGGCTNENDKRAISRISLHSRTSLQQRLDPSRWTTICSST